MIATISGNLMVLNPNTTQFSVLWGGVVVPGVVAVRIDCDSDEHRVKLRVNGSSPVYDQLRAAGVIVKEEG